MLPNQKTRIVPGIQQWSKPAIPFPKPQIKYSDEDNILHNRGNVDLSCAQERLADRVISESKLALEDVKELTSNWKREVEMQIRERLAEVQFLYDETVKQRKVASLENEALSTSNERLKKGLETIKRAISLSQQCLLMRQGRIGTDLCVDEVEKQLLLELKTFHGTQDLLEKANRELQEQLRTFRETIYLLDEDIEHKLGAIQIDKHNMTLTESLSTLGQANDLSRNFCKYTLAEWQEMSDENIKRNVKQINNASSLRSYIDLILQQVCDDLINQTERTNFIFKRRIDETRRIKHLLEERHSNCGNNIVDISGIITDLEEQSKDKQRSLLLCQTRLCNRGRRSDNENACDWGQQALNLEHSAIQAALCKLKQKLDESKSVLRFLMHTNIVTEEEINVKANSLKIDEVECMTLRETLKFVPF